MEITIKIETGNDAFQNNENDEVSRLVSLVASHIREGRTNGKLHDYNGGGVGRWYVN